MSSDKHRQILPKAVLLPSSNHLPEQRKNSSFACESCKLNRTRCDKQKPCSRCIAQNIQCNFDENLDGRRGRKRQLDEISEKANALDTILTSLRSSDDESTQELLRLTRAGRPVEEIVQHARRLLEQKDLRSRSRARLRQAVTSIASLTDQPLIKVPASPWTTVVDNDEAVSHLISVYFTWHHCAYPSVDMDLFVAEMRSKNLSSQFCSPLLVNSILAVACMYTDHPSAFSDPDDRTARGTHFMEEAMRLWNLEEGKASLTNLQAFPALTCWSTVMQGKDRLGTMYISQFITVAEELTKNVKKSIKLGKTEYNGVDFQRSYHLALWAAFLVQTEVALAWMKPIELRSPATLPAYSKSELRTHVSWQPYPKIGPQATFFSLATNNERYRLYTVAAELLPLILSGSPQDSPLPGEVVLDSTEKLSRLSSIEGRLLKWRKDLPPEVHIDMDGIVPPAAPQVDLLLAYSGFRITTQNLALRVLDKSNPSRLLAEDKLLSACNDIANLLQLLQRTIGLKDFSIYVTHASTLSAYNLMEFLPQAKVSNIFHVAIVALSNASHRWTLTRGIIKMIWITLQERKLESYLDGTTLSLFKLNAMDSWGPQDHRLFEMCSYPNLAAIDERGRDFVEMGELLQEYAEMQLNETEPALTSKQPH